MGRRSRLLAIVFAISGCDSPETHVLADATVGPAEDSCVGPFCNFNFADAASSGDGSYATPDALPAPPVDCVLDAGDGGAVCPLPVSFCIDQTWLEYFDDGVCVDGGCEFQAHLRGCDICEDAGCINQETAPAP